MPIQLDGTTGISTTGNIIADGTLSVGSFTPVSVSVTGNVTAAGIMSATGNITGNYFIGNGSQLTGVATSQDSLSPFLLMGA